MGDFEVRSVERRVFSGGSKLLEVNVVIHVESGCQKRIDVGVDLFEPEISLFARRPP